MEQNSAQVFSEHWSIYQKVILYNYMHHADFAKKIAAVFVALNQKAVHILDIGCGDAVTLTPLLQKISIASYTGYDLSSSALELAAENLSKKNFATVLKEGNMMELIVEEEKQFDLIHSSFAIHHLHDDEKKKLLEACYNRLLPEGKMIYIDVFREKEIGRDMYIKEYFSYIRNDWSLLTANEKQPIYEHINQYDFPSDFNETINWIQSFGFIVAEKYQPDHRHALLVLDKK